MDMRLVASLVVLTALPAAALADDFDYTFVEGGLVNSEIDAVDIDGDGFGFSGSYAIGDSMRIVGSYNDQDFDFGIDASEMTLGLGFQTGLSQDLDFVADLSYVDVEVANVDDTGYEIDAGIRARTGDKVELEAGLAYVDIFDDSDTALRVGGRYYFSNTWAAGLSLLDADMGLSWMLGIRAEFGGR